MKNRTIIGIQGGAIIGQTNRLLRIRIKQADLLRKNGATVEVAAVESGFCDSGSYIRSYRRLYGRTPTGRK